jgi:molecular chaperone DnaJ
VAVPSHLTAAQKDALAKFQASGPDENPRDDLIAKARR